MFNKNKLSHAILVAVASSSLSVTVVAQESGSVVEEVYVSGIRASLERAMDIKREAGGVVEAISAEDIGKFPDANLAESLQRISGVSIDRNAGEGNSVSVRGFGPNFNMVTTNGRQMPSSGAGRSFNFNDLAAELVSGVEVQKTSSAVNPSGGIGSTININTARPLDIGAFRVAGSVKGVSDIDEGSVTPEVSGLISNTFADGTFGVLFAASHQQRKYEQERVAVDGWVVNPNFGNRLLNPETNKTPNTFMPQNYNISLQESERTRTNANLVFQYAPSDSLTVTADYLYSELHNEHKSSQFGVWFNSGGVQNVLINENGTAIDMFEEGTFDNIQNWNETVSENNSFGINVEWEVTDKFSMTFDANFAKSEQNPGGEFNQYQAIVGYRNQQRFRIMDGAELPTVQDIYNANPGRVQAPNCAPATNTGWTDAGFANCYAWAAANGLDPNGSMTGTGPDGQIATDLLRAHRNDIQSGNTEDELNQFKIEGNWSEDNIVFRAGLMYTDQSKNNRLKYNAHEPANVVEDFAGMYGFPVIGADALTRRTTIGSGFLDQFSGRQGLPSEWVYFDPSDVFAYIWPAMGDGYSQIPTEWSPNSYLVEEETLASYIQLDVDTEFFNMPVHIQSGVRLESTDITSTGSEQVLTGFEYADPTSLKAIYAAGGMTQYTEKQSYDVLLPNLAVRLNITDDLVGRFAAGRTITRPNIASLRSTRTLGITRPGGELNANAGNPGLKPFSADNIDLGLEWYYSELSYVSVGYFEKFINDFIVGGVREGTINNVTDPSSNGGSFENPNTTTADVGVFKISSDVNGPTAKVRGTEIAIQHAIGETGFGVGANATFVSTNRELDVEDVSQRFAITGLSDSANMMGYYENGPFQARITYNWRDSFLQGFSQVQGGDAVIVEDYGQWDFSMSYDITDNVTVLLEGINVTSEGYRSHGRYKEQLYEAISTGSRYAVGIRASF
ncbi:TonB-dependent receptor [Cellvibrio polysaccharolyticus]|nr:TonB-dependent receptor [Cellvibrio polysaccharolyticus]